MTRFRVVGTDVAPALLVAVTDTPALAAAEVYVRVLVSPDPTTVQPVAGLGAPKLYEAMPDRVVGLLAVRVTEPVEEPLMASR